MFPPIMYWFPKSQGIPEAWEHLFPRDANGIRPNHISRRSAGPLANDVRGCLATRFNPSDGYELRYAKDVQRWDTLTADGKVFIGCPVGVQPATFRRANAHPGTYVELADGNKWLIPTVNPFSPSFQLPHHEAFIEGRWRNVVSPLYGTITDRALEMGEYIRDQALTGETRGEMSIDADKLRQFLADVIALNYEVNIHELSVLRVFSQDVYWPAVMAAIDWADQLRLMELALEGQADSASPFSGEVPDTSNTLPGEREDSESTGPPVQTSI